MVIGATKTDGRLRAWMRRRGVLLTGCLAILAAVLLSNAAYSQVAASAQPSGESIWNTIAKGGSAAPWIPQPESPWLQGLHITGLLQNTTGLWINPHGIRTNTAPFYAGSTATNLLATERNFMQVDTNYDLGGRNHFFLRFWGVYEPQYDYSQSYRSVDAQALNENGNQTGCFPQPFIGAPTPAARGVIGFSHCTASSAASYYDRLEFREAWWRTTLGPLRIFTGRQIVTWGESLAFRIADVVNPQDVSWNFGFANLEQSRIPLWMLHPILELPEWGIFRQNFAEVIWAPAAQPIYNNWLFADTPDERYAGAASGADAVNRLDAFGGRFDGNGQLPFGGLRDAPFKIAAYPQAAFASNFVPPNHTLRWSMPVDTWRNSQEGIRLHSLVSQTYEVTMLYWHGHQYFPAGKLVPIGGIAPALPPGVPIPPCLSGPACLNPLLPIDQIDLIYPQLNDIGVTMNRPLNLPGRLGDIFPFVLRTEGVWQDRSPFASRSLSAKNGIKMSNTLNTLVALDLDQAYAPWLTSTGGSLTVNLEWNNYSILNFSKFMEYSPLTFQRVRHNEESFIFAASTSWWWQSIAPQWVMVYNPDGNSFLLFPSLTLVPPWTSQYFMKLQYVGIVSSNIQDASTPGSFIGGQFKGKNFVLAQFQWNFNLL